MWWSLMVVAPLLGSSIIPTNGINSRREKVLKLMHTKKDAQYLWAVTHRTSRIFNSF